MRYTCTSHSRYTSTYGRDTRIYVAGFGTERQGEHARKQISKQENDGHSADLLQTYRKVDPRQKKN